MSKRRLACQIEFQRKSRLLTYSDFFCWNDNFRVKCQLGVKKSIYDLKWNVELKRRVACQIEV